MSYSNRWRDIGLLFVYIVRRLAQIGLKRSELTVFSGLQHHSDLSVHLFIPHPPLEPFLAAVLICCLARCAPIVRNPCYHSSNSLSLCFDPSLAQCNHSFLPQILRKLIRSQHSCIFIVHAGNYKLIKTSVQKECPYNIH
jgi:hypothetical protein